MSNDEPDWGGADEGSETQSAPPSASLPPVTTLRLPSRAMEWLEKVRKDYSVSRTTVIRVCINVARAHPEDFFKRMDDLS